MSFPQNNMVNYRIALPNHVVFDLYGVDFARANDLDGIRAFVRRIVPKLNSDMVGEIHKRLHPHGIIYVALLLQSHVSVHTWPEIGYVALDVYTCSDVPVTEVLDDVLSYFKPRKHVVRLLDRPVILEEDQGAT